MTEKQAIDARKLFEKEVASLVDIGMMKADAASISPTLVASRKTSRQPVLAEGESVAEKHEMLFEHHFQGEVPATLVGIEFSKLEVIDHDMMVWESVLRDLARKLLEEGVATALQLYNREMGVVEDKAVGEGENVVIDKMDV